MPGIGMEGFYRMASFCGDVGMWGCGDRGLKYEFFAQLSSLAINLLVNVML